MCTFTFIAQQSVSVDTFLPRSSNFRMTKFIILLSPIFLNFSANAEDFNMTPAVGDEAKYAMEWHMADGKIQTTHLTFRLTAFNKSTDSFTVELNNEGHSQTYDAPAKTIADGYYGKDIIKDCSKINGHVEVVTVPAGKIETCAYDYMSGGMLQHGWSGLVPFNLVKQIITSEEGDYVIQTLESFIKN